MTDGNPNDTRGVTPRVVILCLTLAVAFGYIIPVVDFKLCNTFLGATHLPPGAVGVLIVLVLVVNPLLHLVSKRFSRNEVLTVYITCLFSSLVPGHGAENFFVPNIIAPFYFATRENKWLTHLLPFLKPWFTPAVTSGGTYNRTVVENWYPGTSGGAIPWGAWMVPLLAWGSLVLASYIMLASLSVMLRAQWADHEALNFPLLKIPLQLTEDLEPRPHTVSVAMEQAPLARNPLMWFGFSIAAAIQLLNGLNFYFPDVPAVPLGINLNALFSSPPWNQIGWIPFVIYPIAVGIAYLLTSEISFSLWAFVWIFKLQYVVAYYLGYIPGTLPSAYPALPDKLFTGFQQGGCYLAYVGMLMWSARRHLAHVVRRAFGRIAPLPDERREMVSYPAAFWGFTLGFAYMVAFSCLAGVRCDVAILLWLSYLVLAIGLTRIIVEGGMLFVLSDTAPLAALARLFHSGPSTWLTFGSGLAPAAFLQSALVQNMRAFSMPSYMQGFKLAHDRGIEPKPLRRLLVAVVLISFTMSLYMAVRLGYDNGGLQLGHRWWAATGSVRPVQFIDAVANNKNSAGQSWFWLSIGALFTYAMMFARGRFAWFPLHPIGYMVALTYPGHIFWTSIFLGWLCKSLITRYGGVESYRKMIPFFLGLALGDIAMMLFWLAIDGWQGRTGHMLMPG